MDLLIAHEAAGVLGISRTRLIQLVERGELEPLRTPTGWRLYHRSDVERLRDERARRAVGRRVVEASERA
jgi:predicted site-specific integrase-resolvase